MRCYISALFCSVALLSCSADSALLEDTPALSAAASAPLCAASPMRLFAETRGDLGAISGVRTEDALALAFSGSSQFDYGLFFATLNKSGDLQERQLLKIPGPAPLGAPQLQATKSGFVLVFEDRRDSEDDQDSEIYLARLDPNGQLLGKENNISKLPGGSHNPNVASSSDDFLVAWAEETDDTSPRCQEQQECLRSIYVAPVRASGEPSKDAARLSDKTQNADNPSIVSTNGGYLLAYQTSEGDESEACTKSRALCQYSTKLLLLDTSGVPKGDGSLIKNLMDPQLFAEADGSAYLVGWAEGVYLGKVSASGAVQEIGRNIVPTRGVPQISLAVGNDTLWLAISQSQENQKPEEIFLHTITMYRLDKTGKRREDQGFAVSYTAGRSEQPRVFASGDSALVLWREVRASYLAACQERPQACSSDLAAATISCGTGAFPPIAAPRFAPMIQVSRGDGAGWSKLLQRWESMSSPNAPASKPTNLPTSKPASLPLSQPQNNLPQDEIAPFVPPPPPVMPSPRPIAPPTIEY